MSDLNSMNHSNYYQLWHAKDDHDYALEDRFSKINKIILDFRNNNNRRIKILDVGCGEGAYLKYLSKSIGKDFELYGIDIFIPSVEDSEKLHINFLEGDLSKDSFSLDELKNSFDIIVAGEIIEHVENTDLFLINLLKLKSKEGILIITTPNLASWIDRIMLLFGWQPFSTEVSYESRLFGREKFYSKFGVYESQPAGHLRCFTRGAMRSFLLFHSCKIVHEDGYYQQPYLINKIISKIKSLSEGLIFVVKN
jgi:2-polyprenyl-3-methyl-5-hydroxy-6-metoxy-1,4-benzoquinol methylase